jgi:hypothetical protein
MIDIHTGHLSPMSLSNTHHRARDAHAVHLDRRAVDASGFRSRSTKNGWSSGRMGSR